jgi:fructokinase
MPDAPGAPHDADALYGAIETGGTKIQCAVARGVGDIVASERFVTASPDRSFAQVVAFFERHQQHHGPLSAFGIASFGPVDLDLRSPTYGHILSTPKPGWRHYDLRARLGERFGKPIYLDTDVNAAALGEWHHCSSDGLRSLAYVTVGTGIGGGFISEGRTQQGPWHSEMGHVPVQRHPDDLQFPGVCPFHQDCLEGLANGPAIVARWGAPMSALLQHPDACGIIGGYLGQLAASMVLMLSPERIVFGGGVMTGGALLPWIRQSTRDRLGGYVTHALLQGTLDHYIVSPALQDRSGICGAILLAAYGARGSYARS